MSLHWTYTKKENATLDTCKKKSEVCLQQNVMEFTENSGHANRSGILLRDTVLRGLTLVFS